MVKSCSAPDARVQCGSALPLKGKRSPDSHGVAGAAPLPESIRLPYLPSPEGPVGMGTTEIHCRSIVEHLFRQGRLDMYHSELDCATVGGAVPGSGPLKLPVPPEFRADAFAQSRELGVFDIGGPGSIPPAVPAAAIDLSGFEGVVLSQ
jgi:hypothetical protein